MKKSKIISVLLSGVMAISALGSIAVSAEEEKLYTFSELEAMPEEEFFALDNAKIYYDYVKNSSKEHNLIRFKFIGIPDPLYKSEEIKYKIFEMIKSFDNIDLRLSICTADTVEHSTGYYDWYINVCLDGYIYENEEITDERCLYVAKSYYCLNQFFRMGYNGSEITYGDANNDGKIDIIDAAFIAKKIAGKNADQLSKEADYNQDGKRDILDAAAIARYVAKMYTMG